MFTLPSMWNLIVSTIVFVIAAWYIHRYLDEQEMPKGTTRSILVFVLASIVSWGSGEAADWAQERIEGRPGIAAQAQSPVPELVKSLGQVQQR